MAMLYSDEDFSYPVVKELRLLGHDVVTAQESGQASLGVADSAVCQARSLERERRALQPGWDVGCRRNWPPDSWILAFDRQYSDRLLGKTGRGQYIS